MNKRVMFRHMDNTESLQAHVDKQLERIEHFLENEPLPISIDFTLEASKTKAHPRVELRIKTPHYDQIIQEEHNGTDMYEIIDRTVERMYRQLLEAKQKHVDDLKHREKLEKTLPEE